MGQILIIIIGSLMAVVMLVVVGLLTNKKATLKGRHTPSIMLAGGSFGAFFGIVLNEIMSYGHSHNSDFLLLGGLILGFLLAIAARTVFMSQRARVG